jgi:hypothetical protein
MAWIYQSNQPKEDRVIRTVRIGERFPDPIHNGISMPVDSVVSTLNRNGPLYRHVAPMCWVAGDGRGQRLDGFHLNTLLWLKQLPSGEEMELPALSTTQFRWRLRDAALASAERSGVSSRPVIEMCQQFGADVPMLRPGEVVANRIDLSTLPVGSVYYSGHPAKPDMLDVWEVVTAGHHRHILGPKEQRQMGQPVVIHTLPGFVDGEGEPPAATKTLAEIALKAWRVGKVYKKRQSWCSVFETTLHALGIDESIVATETGESAAGPGDELSKEQAAALPEGSMLWWGWRNGVGAAVYRRDNTARNKARTRRVWGMNDDGENSHERMIVVSTPSEGTVWNVSARALASMPDGVRFVDPRNNQVTTLDDDARRAARLGFWHSVAITEWVQ